MKIYVDGEMPKSCNGCPFQDYETNTCCGDNGISCAWKDERRAKNCPLQSLAEYEKQVRKQVVKEIKDRLNGFAYLMCSLECPSEVKYGVFVKDIIDVLDQIQNDSEVQNGK